MTGKPVTSINVAYNVALVTVDNLPNKVKLISDILNAIAEQDINIDMINQTPPYRGTINLSFTLPSDKLVKAISTLNKFKKSIPNLHIEVDANSTKISVYGESMRDIPGVAAKIFTLFANNNIDIKLVTTSEVDISYLLYDKDVDKAIEAIKNEFGIE
ncbi:MAG TPA: ACT domain-containing protein [Clostridiaceae bacterium]|nr:ACT domain-containing protein [Clostridiaceae bacterium]